MSTHYSDIIMGAMTPEISHTIVYSTVHTNAGQWKHQRSASLAFVRGIHRWPVNSPHKRPVTRKMFLLDDVIMQTISVPIGPLYCNMRYRRCWYLWLLEKTGPHGIFLVCPIYTFGLFGSCQMCNYTNIQRFSLHCNSHLVDYIADGNLSHIPDGGNR